jgi:FdhE protein
MTLSPWQRRIQRAEELVARHSFAAEILGFYIPIARFQEELHDWIAAAAPRPSSLSSSIDHELSPVDLSKLCSRFNSFLSVAEAHGPKALVELSRELRSRTQNFWCDLLNSVWLGRSASSAQDFLALAFLQPYAELLRSRVSLRPNPQAYALCPVCNRKPSFGVLRQMGDGAARSLVCSFCLTEWQFRRIVCPGCGEENDKSLAVFTTSDFDYIRIECCDVCKTYIKTIDLTKNGHAEPVVDELASAPLDLWAQDRSYAKLQKNVLGM